MNLRAWPALAFVRVLGAGTKVDPPGESFGPRRQWSHEFIWIRAGSVSALIGRRPVKGGPGTLLLVPPGVSDRYRWSRRERTIHSFLHFDVPTQPPGWPPPSRWPLARRLAPGDTAFQLFRQVLSCSPLADPRFAPVLGPAVELLLRLFLAGSPEPAAAEAPGLSQPVERSILWLQERLRRSSTRKPRLEDLARVAAGSPQHLCRLFRRELEIGPMECARLLRVERAGVLLEQTRRTAKEIAHLCGFENPYHFSRAFRAVYGMPPILYRERFMAGTHSRPPSPIFAHYPFQWVQSNPDGATPTREFEAMPARYRSSLR